MLRIRSMCKLVSALCLAAMLGSVPISRAAEAQTLAPGDYTAEQARSVFIDAGYDAGPITSWDWAVPPVSVFRVEDTTRGHVLLVQVYPDAGAAQIADRRPPTGYTSSAWIYNLTLFEATQQDNQRLTDAAVRLATGMEPGGEDALLAASTSGAVVEQRYTDLLFGGAAAVNS